MSTRQDIHNSTISEFYCNAPECCRFTHLISEDCWEELAKEAYAKVMAGAQKLFFWGHPFHRVIESDLFQKLGQYIISTIGVDNYTVEIFNTLAMFALYREPTSRIVSMSYTQNGQHHTSDWVEFQYRELWWMIDTAGIVCPACNMVSAAAMKGRINSMIVIDHEFFWRQLVIKRLNYLVRTPETSNFWSELHYSTRLTNRDAPAIFAKIADLVENGQRPNYVLVDPDNPARHLFIEQDLIDTLMK